MKLSQQEVCGVGIDTFEIGNLAVSIQRKGAELVSLRRGGLGFLHRDGQLEAPASGWAHHSTVMGYFIHRLWQQKSTYRGHPICGGNHGFIRHFLFAAPEVLADGLRYRVPPDQVPADAYPLPVGLALDYRIVDDRLRVEFVFENTADVEAHLSFGLHPGFAVSSLAQMTLSMGAGKWVRHLAPGDFLDGQTTVIDHPGGAMPFAVSDLPGSFLLDLAQVSDPTFVLEDAASGRRVEVDMAGVPYATLWSDGGDFVCIEPCWGLPDSRPPVPFEEKAGIQKIAPGGQLRGSFTINPTQLPCSCS